MSWLANGRCIKGEVYTELSKDQAEALRYTCELTQQELENMPRGPTTYTTLEGSILRESAKAVRFKIETPGHCLEDETFWFPLSQLKSIKRSHDMGLDAIECPDWLIEAKLNDLGKAAGD